MSKATVVSCFSPLLNETYILHILNKKENATLLDMVKMAEKRCLFQFFFSGKIKCLKSRTLPLALYVCFD